MRRFAILLALVLGAAAGAARAADGFPPKRISIGDALTLALRDNRPLRAARLGADAAISETGVARGAMLPRLDLGENFSYTDNPVQVFSDLLMQQEFSASDFAINSLNHPGFLSNFQSQARLSFPVFEGGALIAAYRAAGFAADAQRWQAIQTRQQIEFGAIRAYYTAVLAEQRVAVIDRALTAARAHLAQAQDLYGHGMAVNSDVLRTKALLGDFKQQRILAASQLEIAWSSLAHALGDEDQRLAPIAEPPELRSASPPLEPLDTLTARAIIARPEVKIADSRVDQSREAVTIARADYLPAVEVAGVYENDSENLSRAGNSGALMVTGRLNLFEGLTTQSKVSAARASYSQAELLAQELRRSVSLEVESAYRSLVAAEQALEVAKDDITYADRALRILEDRYSSGLATNVAVLDAQTSREETDMRLVAARIQVVVDRAALNLAAGVDLTASRH